jgi:ferredoxin
MSASPSADDTHTVTVHRNGRSHEIEVASGRPLRQALQRHGISPHGSVTAIANCGGQGHCGACAVLIVEGAPPPSQWLDQGLSALGAGRLSCQVEVDRDMTVRL